MSRFQPFTLSVLILSHQLSPDDAEMANIHRRYLSSVSSRSGPNNALANSTLLDDEEPSPGTVRDGEGGGIPLKSLPEQRILLLQGLLAIGDLSSSLLLLGKFPWVAQSHPVIADLIMRMVAYAVEDVYRMTADDGVMDVEEGDLALKEFGPSAILSASKEVVPTLSTPCPPSTSTKTFEFFYPDWRAGVERWSTPDEVLRKGLRWLSLVRGLGGRTVDVMVKICRIGAAHFFALKRLKEGELGLLRGSKPKDEIRMVGVSQDATETITDRTCSRLLRKRSLGSMSFGYHYYLRCRHLAQQPHLTLSSGCC